MTAGMAPPGADHGGEIMTRVVVLVFATFALAACGTGTGERAATGLIGAAAGAAAGALTEPETVNLGEPVWE